MCAAGSDRRAWHAVERGGFGILDDHQAAIFVDVADTTRAIGAGTRQDDAHGSVARVLGQRAEEDVNRQVQGGFMFLSREPELALAEHHVHVGRDQVDGIALDWHAVLDPMDRQFGSAGQKLVHQALEVRREVLDEHE